jgi:hypothetical protein
VSARIPSVAPKESWKPTSAEALGLAASSRSAANPSRLPVFTSTSSARPSRTAPAITGRARDRHVPADEHGVRRDGGRGDDRLRPGSRLQAAQPARQQSGHERDLRAREREHVVGARGAEGLGRRVVDLRAVAQHHRQHEPALRPRRQRAEERLPRRLAPARRDAPQRRASRLRLPLQQLRRLAVSECRETRAAVGRRPHRHPDGDRVAVQQPRLLGLASHLEAHAPHPRSRSRPPALDPGDVEQKLEASVAQRRVARLAIPNARTTGPRAGVTQGAAQASRLVSQGLDRGRRGAERERGGASAASAARPSGPRAHSSVRRREREKQPRLPRGLRAGPRAGSPR